MRTKSHLNQHSLKSVWVLTCVTAVFLVMPLEHVCSQGLLQGPKIADSFVFVADDFVVNIWQNGKIIDTKQRKLTEEIFGATSEVVTIDIHKGDWVVFQIANNKLRWKGVKLFIGAAMNKGKPVIETDGSAIWTSCDDPAFSDAFISNRIANLELAVNLIPQNEAWQTGLAKFAKNAPGSKAKPIWGKERVTWIKLRVP